MSHETMHQYIFECVQALDEQSSLFLERRMSTSEQRNCVEKFLTQFGEFQSKDFREEVLDLAEELLITQILPTMGVRPESTLN